MLRRSVVDLCLEDVLARLGLEHLLYVLLIERELFGELVRLAKDVDWLLEVMRYQGDSVRAHLVDDAAIGEHSLTADHHTIHHRHRDCYRRVVDLMTLNANLVTFLLDDGTCTRRHTLRGDNFYAQAPFTHTFDHVEHHA